jgi:outer membrane protein TolC
MNNRYRHPATPTRLPLRLLGVVAWTLLPAAMPAQQGQSQSPRAQQVQLSGLPQGNNSASLQQSASPSTTSSVNTINTTVQVQGAYQGSVLGPAPGDGPIPLTFAEAIQRGLQYNLGALDSSASLKQARAQRLSALSQMLPNIYATISESGAKTDLQTIGLSSGALGGAPVPTVVGPYHYYSAEANLSEEFSFTALHNLRSAEQARQAAMMNARDAREMVVLAVSGSYLRVLATQALVASQEAQVKYAEVSYKQAQDQREAGTKAQIDANRSLVELQSQQQRLSSDKAQLIKEQMSLARVIGLPLDRQLVLSETLPTSAPELPGADSAVASAVKEGFNHRADLLAAGLQVRAAEQALSASRSEYLPSFSVNGSFGVQGVNPNKGANVFQATATLNIPIWSSGRVRADVQQADAAVGQRRAELEDKKGVVEHDVRTALLDLNVAAEQVKVAESNRQLALSTLKQSQDRFAAGVTTSVEVVQSQESLVSAELDYINGLFSLNVGRINLARATGQAETAVPNLIK